MLKNMGSLVVGDTAGDLYGHSLEPQSGITKDA